MNLGERPGHAPDPYVGTTFVVLRTEAGCAAVAHAVLGAEPFVTRASGAGRELLACALSGRDNRGFYASNCMRIRFLDATKGRVAPAAGPVAPPGAHLVWPRPELSRRVITPTRTGGAARARSTR
jgi:hypothetical protein